MKTLVIVIAVFLFAVNESRAQFATRVARFWMTHPFGVSEECATLFSAISTNGGQLDLGFIVLPLKDRDRSGSLDSNDAVAEALGLYWRGHPHHICRQRKRLAIELVAATANTAYLGTSPTNLTYYPDQPFPADLLDQARDAARGADRDQIAVFTALLRKFNNAGVTNDLPWGIVECEADTRKDLRKMARNPTTRANCHAK